MSLNWNTAAERANPVARRLRPLIFALAILIAACEGEPERTPAEGRYLYESVHPLPGGPAGDSVRLRGVVYFEETSTDEISGHWEVNGFAPEFSIAEWDEGAYVVYGSTYSGTAVHRIRRAGAPDDLLCEGHFTAVLEDGGERDVPLRCALTPADSVPGAQSTPEPGARQIRPIDVGPLESDSVGGGAVMDTVDPPDP